MIFLDINFFQRVLDILKGIASFIDTVFSGVSASIEVLANLFPALTQAITLPTVMGAYMPYQINLLLGVGIAVSLAAIVLPGFIGGRK